MRLTIAEAAERAQVKPETLRQHIHRGKLATVQEGPRPMIEEAELDRYLGRRSVMSLAQDELQPGEIRKPVVQHAQPTLTQWARLPSHLQDALSEATLKGKPEIWRDALAKHAEAMWGRRTQKIGDLPAHVDKESRAVAKKG